MKMWHCELDDPRISEMDPVRKMWMFNNWIEDQNDSAELAKNHAYLLASFWDPEAVQQIRGEGNVHESSDEDFEESLDIVRKSGPKKPEKEKPIRRRKRQLKQDTK